MTTRKPRIADVAREARVSTGTVSRVLNGDETVRPVRKEAVLAAIKTLDYRPDPIARALRSGSTRTIGVVVRTLRNAAVADFVETILETVAPAGYAVSISDTVMRRRMEQTSVENFMERQYDGVVALNPYSLRSYARAQDAGAKVVTVFSSRPGRRLPPHAIDLDYNSPGTRLFARLKSLGHRRVNFVAPRHAYRASPVASLPAVASGAIEVNTVTSDFEPDVPADDQVQALLAGGATALVLRSESAIQALDALRVAGLRVPDDVSIALWGHAPWRGLVQPPLDAVEVDYRRVGRAAGEKLLNLLTNVEDTGPTQFVGSYVEAGSLAPPPRRR